MNHHSMVGKPITKNGKVVGHEDVQEIPTNQVFHWNRRGYATLQPDDIAALNGAPAASAADSGDEDLNKLTVKELRKIAAPLGATGRKKAELIESIEQARGELAAAE